MARETRTRADQAKQSTESGRNAGTSTTSSTATERDTDVRSSERERQIETSRDRGQQRSTALGRPSYGYEPGSFTLMRRMAEDMDRLFDHFGFGRPGLGLPSLGTLGGRDLWNAPLTGDGGALWSPQVETFQRGNKFVIRADLPGLRKDDVNVEVENDVLTISGERKDEHEEEREGYYRSERSYGRFYRAIPLPEGTNADQVDASFDNGVLEVTLNAPKQEERKNRRIQIR